MSSKPRHVADMTETFHPDEYQPQPINTHGIVLNEEIQTLTELLAKNTHEVWARGRMSEGWQYGPHRNDARKEHPGLVPYEQLTEGEKEYDRNTALETIRVILALGYELVRDNPDGSSAKGE